MVKGLAATTPRFWGFYWLRTLVLAWIFSVSGQNLYANEEIEMFDPSESARLLWSTFLAIEQANDSLNYSVFREISAPEFQRKNTTEDVAELFLSLRKSGIDLSQVILNQPEYDISPQIGSSGLLRMRGKFTLPPEVVCFDVLYQMI
jgi:hypothetical protein